MDTLSSNPDFKKVFDFLVQAEPDDMIPQCDAIFVFGTTNGDVAKHAAHLFASGKAPTMIISGMYGAIRTAGPAGFNSEAEYLASIAGKEGVPQENILLEPKARNTYENVVFGMETYKAAGFSPKTLLLVATPYLLRRARAYFVKNFPEIKIYASAMLVNDDFFTPYRIERIKGEFPRLMKYAEMGNLAPVEVPKDVQEAVGRL